MNKKFILTFVSILVLIGAFLLIFMYSKNLEAEKQRIEDSKTVFSISEFITYQSANATNNDTANKPIWDLNLYQYTDIAFNINNQNDFVGTSDKNTIKNLYIDNIQIIKAPNKGNLSFYYKDFEKFPSNSITEENLINNRIDFNISGDEIALSPSINSNGGITVLSIVNKDIYNNFIIDDISTSVSYDGNLLKIANINLEDLTYTVSFDINIINNLDEHYKCTINFEMPIEDKTNNTTIYDGYVLSKDFDLNNFKFQKM